jgi:hypothetical protein
MSLHSNAIKGIRNAKLDTITISLTPNTRALLICLV